MYGGQHAARDFRLFQPGLVTQQRCILSRDQSISFLYFFLFDVLLMPIFGTMMPLLDAAFDNPQLWLVLCFPFRCIPQFLWQLTLLSFSDTLCP